MTSVDTRPSILLAGTAMTRAPFVVAPDASVTPRATT